MRLIFYDKNLNQIKDLTLNKENLINKRFKRKKSILDIALDNNIDIKYGCMGGSCSACICKILKGKEYIDKEGLHKIIYKGVGSNEILTCIATIKDNISENTIIKIQLLL